MKLIIKTTTIVNLLLIVCFMNKIQAQVTIGSGEAPSKAALLELKTKKADPLTNETTGNGGGGLGLPRVKLVDIKTLEPFILKTDNEWNTTNQNDTKKKHAGLMVYNVETTKKFKQDVYIWDGEVWNPIGGLPQQYFYIPSFNIQLTAVGTNVTKDLYAEYETQFNGTNGTFVSSNPKLTSIPVKAGGGIYKREELDYIITYYDKNIMENVKINDGSIISTQKGVLSFDVKSNNINTASFINVVFVIK